MSTAIVKPQWGFVSIALMVLGFIVWWPLGLAMLAYIVWGEYFGGSADKAQAFVSRQKSWAREHCGPRGRHGFHSSSGNAAFDEYRAEQLRRLEEERKRLDEEIAEFHAYMRNLRMARDREEFDRFMRERRGNRPNYGESDSGQ